MATFLYSFAGLANQNPVTFPFLQAENGFTMSIENGALKSNSSDIGNYASYTGSAMDQNLAEVHVGMLLGAVGSGVELIGAGYINDSGNGYVVSAWGLDITVYSVTGYVASALGAAGSASWATTDRLGLRYEYSEPGGTPTVTLTTILDGVDQDGTGGTPDLVRVVTSPVYNGDLRPAIFWFDGSGGGGNLNGAVDLFIDGVANTAPILGDNTTAFTLEGTSTVGTYPAVDYNEDDITYSLSGADAALFEIDSSANLTFVSVPDFSVDPGPFTVVITATDDGTGALTDTQTITVNVVEDTQDLRTVSNNNHLLTDTENQSNYTRIFARWPFVIGSGDVTKLVVSDLNWYSTFESDLNNGNSFTVAKMAIQNATDSAPVTQLGSRSWVVGDGVNDLRHDPINAEDLGFDDVIPQGTQLWIKYEIDLPTPGDDLPYPEGRDVDATAGSQALWASDAAVISDVDTLGAFTTGGTLVNVQSTYCPMILGTFETGDPDTFIGVGDSILFGILGDENNPGGYGLFQRFLNYDSENIHAGINLGRSAIQSNTFTGATANRYLTWAAYAKRAIEECGTNDFGFSGDNVNLATLQSRLQTLWTAISAQGVEDIIRTKLGPRTTSTDSFATEENQTTYPVAWQSAGAAAQLNTWFDTRVGTEIDLVVPMDAWRGSVPHLWVVDGTSNFATTDGTHPNAAYYAILAAELHDTIYPPDTTPDAFSFTDQTEVPLNTVRTSNAITVTGIDAVAAISITGGTYSINGGSYTSSPGSVSLDDTVTVRVTSSASNTTTVDAVLTIGGVSDTFSVTTAAAAGDSTPDAFAFTDQTGVAVSTVITSNEITISGIDVDTAISIVGGTYSINGGSYVSTPGTVANGNTARVRVTSSASNNTAVNAVLTIGGVSDTFTVTTLVADTTPEAYTFTAQNNVALSTVITSNAITIAGINTSTAISITGAVGATYSVNLGTPTSSPGTVINGDSVRILLPSSATNSTPTSATLDIGGVTATFTVTTLSSGGATVVNITKPCVVKSSADGKSTSNEIVYKGRDNLVRLTLFTYDGNELDLAAVTRILVSFVTDPTVIDTDITLNVIDWSVGDGEIVLSMNDLNVAAGKHKFWLSVFDTAHPDGQVVINPGINNLSLEFIDEHADAG